MVENWSTSSSIGFLRCGVPFAVTEIPSGYVPEIRRNGTVVPAQFDELVTYADGSLQFAVCHLRDTLFWETSSRTYAIHAVPGSYVNTGSKSLSDILNLTDFQITYTNLTQYDGATKATRGSGSAVAKFNEHATVPTRVWKYHSGPVCESWNVWGPARDSVTGVADPHLTVEWYVSIWKNTDGSIADFEFGGINSQFWWSIPDKFHLNYNATLKNGYTIVETYNDVQHPYRSQWATVRKISDNNHARRHWLSGTPTLFYKPSKAYWVKTGIVPPLDTTFIPNPSPYNSALVPCGPINHRPGADGVGGYMGRGLLPDSDCRAFMRQTPTDYRYARTNAHAGLHIPYHFRSNRTRQRPASAGCPGGDSLPDVANTIIPMIMQPKSAADYTFTADGMPISTHSYGGEQAPVAYRDSYVYPLGGTSPWALSLNDTHGVAHSYFMYLHEGERYFMQAVLDHAAKLNNYTNGNVYSSVSFEPYKLVPVYAANFSYPATIWSGIANMAMYTNHRHMGWTMMHMAHAWAVCPDNDVQRGYIETYVDHVIDYFHKYLSYMSASQLASGCFAAGANSSWMENFITMGCWMAWQTTKNTKARELAEFSTLQVVGLTSHHLYRIYEYRTASIPKINPSTWEPGTNEFFAPEDVPATGSLICSISGTSDIVTRTSGNGWLLRNGDPLWPSTFSDAVGVTVVPPELVNGEQLYAVNCSATVSPMSFQVSRSVGGPPIDFLANYTNKTFSYIASQMDDYTVATIPGSSIPDSYMNIAGAAINIAAFNGHAGALGRLSAVNTFISTINDATWTTWRLRHVA